MLEADPHPLTGKRTKRDVTIDVLMVLLAIAIGILAVSGRFENRGPLLAVDIALGVLGCVALVWRRRWPLAIAVILTVLSAFASFITGPSFLALFSLAVHKPLRYSLAVSVLGVGASMSNFYLYPDAQADPWSVVFAFSLLLSAVAVGWGTMVRNRRQLLISLAERARTVEAEQRERIANARATERERLAREMHDVLAHRMSLLSVHAGALEFRPDAPPEDIRRAAGVIRAGVHQMLVDLRDVIGMLREDTEDFSQPTRSLSTLSTLFDEAEEAGSQIRATIDICDLDDVPGVVSRAAYRIVQEGLTNARKHAGAVPVTVHISGGPGDGLSVRIHQPLTTAANATIEPIPGAGSGLVGINERVTLAGGELSYGVVDRNFVLTARLPWEGSVL
jgi:signal transduction histidine kinase